MRKLCVLWLLIAAACASQPIKKIDLAALAAADAQVLQGCYDCLLEARATYERIGVASGRSLVIARLFETQLLIAVRERELAMDSSVAFARAREVAAELPPPAEAARYLALAELVPPDTTGTPHRESLAFRATTEPSRPGLNDELLWLKTAGGLREAARQYLSLAVDCGYIVRAGRPGPMLGSTGDLWSGSVRVREVPADAPPLVAYRISICDDIGAKGLEGVRAAVPQFSEAAFFLARLDVADAQNTGGVKARDYLTEAYKRFPASPAVTYLSGSFSQSIGDCREALRFYDETIALKPVHENALLGRTMCLIYLERHDESIATATHMIELRTDNWDEAYYWRAWAQHHLGRLAPARADVTRAKELSPRKSKAFTLAGMIEHDQDDLGIAETDLNMAKRLESKQCVAMWYLGLVKLKQSLWLESGKHFEDSLGCYTASVAEDEFAIKAWETREKVDPEFKARQIASFKAVLAQDQRQQYASAFNAANFYTQAGDLVKARTLIEIAARDPGLADKVLKLREILKDK